MPEDVWSVLLFLILIITLLRLTELRRRAFFILSFCLYIYIYIFGLSSFFDVFISYIVEATYVYVFEKVYTYDLFIFGPFVLLISMLPSFSYEFRSLIEGLSPKVLKKY